MRYVRGERAAVIGYEPQIKEAFVLAYATVAEPLIDVEAFIKNMKNAKAQEKIDLKYKIKVKYNNGTTKESQDVEVSYNVSSVKRTWGMIKELFR